MAKDSETISLGVNVRLHDFNNNSDANEKLAGEIGRLLIEIFFSVPLCRVKQL